MAAMAVSTTATTPNASQEIVETTASANAIASRRRRNRVRPIQNRLRGFGGPTSEV
jgi:hypothetical protein